MTDVTTSTMPTDVVSATSRHRARFHPLTVAGVERLTDDAVTVTFAVPDDLVEEYRFEPGQHLTVRADIGGQEVR
jgi:ring-1,2-phenylacetyl-CoA epoxidase subunit PaaE